MRNSLESCIHAGLAAALYCAKEKSLVDNASKKVQDALVRVVAQKINHTLL